MTETWQYQIRIYFDDATAPIARADPADPALAPLPEILSRHGAVMKCQYDAFADYVAAAEREGVDAYPLYKWTKATVDDPAKQQKYLRSFTVYVGGEEVYDRPAADALEGDLQPLVGGILTRLTKHDTNPARNPQPPPEYR